ncbi:MAG: PQQ-binding-like beta-propeller repeat protein [Alphaproteobacteria bacterium]|nr:PQQ-binding-like beta-propeller repeat protein [Alphaproteobacteria bacterium]
MKRLAGLTLTLLAAACGHRGPDNTDWEFLGNSSDMQHHSELGEISKDSVKGLGLAWSADMPTPDGLVGNPLVKDGIVFQGGPSGQIFANDVRSGKQLWTFGAAYDDQSKQTVTGYWARRMNRGVALWGDKAIIATGDCRLIAVNQKTGKQVWTATSCDSTQMYGITSAPRVGDGMVFTGNACMDSGSTRGYVDAFDAETGKHKWRFFTVPGDPSKPQDNAVYTKAEKTWGTNWYGKSHGCGSVWDGLTYDSKLHQLVFGVGGPSPFDPTRRALDAGDELFTNSVVAVDGRTGAYKWHFKETPNDGWNYDASVGIMIADLPIDGQSRHVVLSVPKNGFAYVFDAQTGKYLKGSQVAPMNWAKGLDANGRPIPDKQGMYWLNRSQANVVLPSLAGSHGWEALAYDPVSHLVYIPTMVMPTSVKNDSRDWLGGILMDFYYGSSGDPKWKSYGNVVAWDPVAGSVKWRSQNTPLPINGGLLHTAGGLVFQGMADGRLVAFDEATGKEVWSHQTGGAIRGAPSSVMVDGAQYIIVATGNGAASATGSYFAKYNSTEASRTAPRLLAFRLGGNAPYPALNKVIPIPTPPAPRQDLALADEGKVLFETNGCVDCHGIKAQSSGGTIPSLNRMPPNDLAMLKSVVQHGALAQGGMPKFKDITDLQARQLFAYIINEAWDAHDGKDFPAPKKQ